MGYTREFLIDAFLWRYTGTLLTGTKEDLDKYVSMITNYYDEVGRDTFRIYGSLDAAELQKFKLATGRKSQYNRYSEQENTEQENTEVRRRCFLKANST